MITDVGQISTSSVDRLAGRERLLSRRSVCHGRYGLLRAGSSLRSEARSQPNADDAVRVHGADGKVTSVAVRVLHP